MDQIDSVDALASTNGAVTTADHEPPPAVVASVLPSFLAELTRAMQAAAEQQREEIAAVIEDEAAGQVDTARKRAAIEAEELRRLAEEDVTDIEAWAADETERIRLEAGRRTEKRRKDLEAHLAKHDSIITTEIDGVGIAVQEYRATLDQFFDELHEATSPAEIARRAGSLPPPPDLDNVRGLARASAVAELAVSDAVQDTDESAHDEPEPPGDEPAEPGPGLGVMDPEAVGRSEELPVDPIPDDAVAASAQPSAAARLLRSLSSWSVAGHDDDRGTRGS